MLKQIVRRFLKHRHFWRDVGFDELSEIYVSMMFRGLSMSLISIFVPLYMFKLQYSLFDIILVQVWYFTFRAFIFDVLAGYFVSRIGPKHTILCSYFTLIISTGLFLTLPQMAWPIWLIGGIWGASSSLFAVPFHVDFSKVKHTLHGGKELGYVNMMEKLGGVIGPVAGGVVASLFGGQYIFGFAIIMLLLGGLPLLKTGEPVELHTPLNFRKLPIKKLRRDLGSFMAYGIELSIGGYTWQIYLAFFVLASGTAYAKLGLLASVSVITSMLAAYTIGKLIDAHHGRQLLRLGAIANALLHLFRPFVGSYPIALGVNIVNEGVTVGYHMPYIKGMYDAADELPDLRTTYLVSMELISSIAKLSVWLCLLALVNVISDRSITTAGFVIAALASLLIMTESFKALASTK